MPKYVVERDMPGLGKLTQAQLQAASQKSCAVLHRLWPTVQWLESYVTENKLYCVYIAPDETAVQAHADQSGFAARQISAVKQIIDPTTAE